MSTTVRQYNDIAGNHAAIEDAVTAYRDHVEMPSLLRLLDPVAGKNILDAGCGDGVYAREFARRGAAHTVGVDISPGMIEVARAREEHEPMGIEYHVHDLVTMPALGTFDVVTAAAVLHYAPTREALRTMCERMCDNLVPGGLFAAFVGNPDSDAETAEANGFVLHRPARLPDGTPFSLTIPTTPPTEVTVHYWSRAALEDILRASGFTDVRWETVVDPAAQAPLERPVNLLLSARKAGSGRAR